MVHQFATPHGVVAAARIPDAPDPVPDDVLERLPGAEADYARTLRGYRQVQFVGGRIALRHAVGQLGMKCGPVLSTPRGAPRLPAGLVGSVSHKRDLAIGMAARDNGWTLGVDLEDFEPARLSIASRVLRPAELADLDGLPDAQRWIAIVQRFSLKESIYKALDPYVQRYVAFEEAEVRPDLQGSAEVALHLAKGEGPFEVSSRYEWLWGRLLTSVRIRPRQDS
ncbi:MAG: 4'-phosphopantetheinyl transferase superfamily protein [Myxococcales bacterium]|nr:4'-phosphopantetheinyl transferase superfamily protein [Myxococcales bacterium]